MVARPQLPALARRTDNQPPPSLPACLLAWLQLYAERLAAYLKEQQERPPSFLRDACGTMWVNRSRFQFRKTFVASTVPELAAKVDAFAKAATTEPCGEGRKMQVRPPTSQATGG